MGQSGQIQGFSGDPVVRNVSLGVIVSLAAHLGVGLLLSRAELVTAQVSGDELEPDLKQVEPLRFGIERSAAATINWVGFETPEDHAAAASTVEQAAVTPVVGAAQVASEDQPVEAQPELAQSQPPVSPAPVETEPEQQQAESARPSGPILPMDVFEPVPTAPARKDRALVSKAEPKVNPSKQPASEDSKLSEEKLKSASKPEAQPEKKEVARTDPKQEAAETKKASKAVPSGTPGIKDAREADASSIRKTLNYHPGKPLAAQGLEITTVRPRFSMTVQAIARPRNPVVEISFGSDGKVRRADFVRRKGQVLNTGDVHVDGPLLDAVYRWRAKGKALDELEKEQTLQVQVRLLLGG